MDETDRRGRRTVGRRAVLGAGILGLGAAAGAGVVLHRVDERVGGVVGGRAPAEGVEMSSGSFASRHRDGAETGWMLARPSGVDGPRALVVLHGKGGDHRAAFESLQLDRALATVVEDGVAPFAVMSVDGGDTYWHARADGTDSGAMVTEELLPLLEDEGVRTDRVALLGWSMGGYGALLLAGRLGRRRVACVVAESAALWHSPGESAAGAFDDAEDYESHLVMGRQADLRGIPVRVDCGTEDPFYAANVTYAQGFSSGVTTRFGPGGHTTEYWRGHAVSQLTWVGPRLTRQA